jgi:diguanylate cyclase (GGDEF)-like protein/PAS domain S-box-containing protein
MHEVEDRVWADEELRASEERFRVVAAHAPIGVFASEVGLRLGYVNHRFGELWGRHTDEVLGTGWLDSVEPEDLQTVVDATCSVLSGEEIDLPIRVRHPEEGTRWVRLRATPVLLHALGAGFVGSVEDVTDETQHEAELTHQARHDPLTGLPNRVLLWEQIREVLSDRRAGDGSLALLFFDLDNFKLVNDSLGHVAGDQLLVEVASRLQQSVRDGDAVARFGGDEFVVLCRRIASADDAVALADRLLREVARPMVLCDQELVITASIGVVVTDDLSSDVESLVADADVAMYQAKERGKNGLAFFDEGARSEFQERLSLASDLRRALDREELSVAFQPVVDVESGVLVGVEALLRWVHPTRGPVPPVDVVTVAEETGLIGAVGTWVLRAACRQFAAWRAEFGAGAPGYVAVNVSGHQLMRDDLQHTVEAALAEAGLRGEDLCLELTESVLMGDVEAALTAMNGLKAQGVRFAIDDFGTGYSSLAYLKRFPVELLKVDRSFVSNLTDGGEDAAIVAAVVALGQALGLSVVAEGVEFADQMDELREVGCSFAQGYLLGRPVPANDIAERLRTDRSEAQQAARPEPS